tara:strand:+ start:1024 stop:2004 length:981 start_codon:yes stop_codon:yes gene_type:complete
MAYIGKEPQVGNYQICDAISVVNGQAAYTMQVSSTNVSPESANHMIVSLNGIIQKPGSSFTISGSTITFASNLATGDVIDYIMLLGNVLDLGTPSDNTVTAAKIGSNAVTAAKINNDIISGTTALAEEPADTDEFLVSDGGTLKRIDYSHIKGGGTHTLISTTNITSGVSSVVLSSVFTDTYRDYLIVCSAMHPASQDVNFHIRFYNASGEISSTYRFIMMALDDGGSSQNSNSTNDAEGRIFNSRGVGGGSQQAFNVKGTIFYPKNSNHYTHFDYQGSCHNENDGKNLSEVGSITYEGTDAIVGIKFFMSSGNIDTGNIKIYGIT